MLTPPGRPLEVGWAQEFARWIWHLFVLPTDLARPWPRWAHRFIKPLVLAVAAQIDVTNPRSLRSWALHLTLINPPQRAYWSNPTEYQRMRRRRAPLLAVLVQHLAVPYLGPVVTGIAARIEVYSRVLSDAFARANLLVRSIVLALVMLSLLVSATTPLSIAQQCLLLALMWTLTMFVRQLPGYGPGIIMMVFSIVASSRYIWWRLTQTTDLNPGFEWLLGTGLLIAECYTWLVMVLGYVQNARPLRRRSAPLPEDRSLWPTVDVFIPSYNESLQVVKPTVLQFALRRTQAA